MGELGECKPALDDSHPMTERLRFEKKFACDLKAP